MLVSTVELYHRVRKAGPLGVTGAGTVGLDWGAVIDRKDAIIRSWSAGKRASLEKVGITILQGRARFTGPRTLEVEGRAVAAPRFVVATGSAPGRPPIEGRERALTSEELFGLKRRPGRLVVLGGGIIGMEMGFCLARAGSQVTILHRGERFLSGGAGIDEEMADALLEIGRRAGIVFRTGMAVKRITPDGAVEAETAGTLERFDADVVLAATGRPPRTEGLDLDKAGVALSPRHGGLMVNEYLQSVSAPHVYAAGDVIGAAQHTPVAWYEGPIAARNALQGNQTKIDLTLLPTSLFTIPALAQVGLTEAGARRRGLKVAVNRSPMEHNPAAGVRAETEGLVKAVYEEGTDRLLGVHVLGSHAEDLVQIAAAGMRGGLTRADFAAMHYVFPTLGGAIFDAMAGW